MSNSSLKTENYKLLLHCIIKNNQKQQQQEKKPPQTKKTPHTISESKNILMLTGFHGEIKAFPVHQAKVVRTKLL